MAEVFGNFAQVQAYLLSLIPRVEAASEVVEEKAADIVAGLAAARSPVLTGETKASVDAEGGQVTVGGAGFFQEYGTRRHKAQPFLRPAKEASEPIVKAMAEGIITAATR